MAVPNGISMKEYSTDGTTRKFPIPFPFPATAEIKVSYVPVTGQDAGGAQIFGAARLLAEGTDYTISGVLSGKMYASGELTLTSAPATGRLYIDRDMSIVQQTVYEPNGAIPAKTLEADFDRLIMICQMLKAQLARCIQVDYGYGNSVSELQRQLGEAVNSALNSAEEAADSAVDAALFTLGKLEFEVPQCASADQRLKLRLDFSTDGLFGAEMISVDSQADSTAFRVVGADGTLAEPSSGGFAPDDAGTILTAIPGQLGFVADTVYYCRYRWEDGTDIASPWQLMIYYPPQSATSEDPGGGGGGGGSQPGGSTGVPVADLPDVASGWRLGLSGGNLTLSPGYGADDSKAKILRTTAALTSAFAADFLKANTDYTAYLLVSSAGEAALWGDPGTPKYDVPWTAPMMLANDFPIGYQVAASSIFDNTRQPYKAFDKISVVNDASAWVSQNKVAMPQYIQMEFPTPRAVTEISYRNRSAQPWCKRLSVLKKVGAEWTNIGESNADFLANSAGTVSFATPVVCSGIRIVCEEVWGTYLYCALAEVSISGYDSRPDPAIPVTIPEGYSYRRKVGAFRTDSSKAIETVWPLVEHSRSGVCEGKVWVSDQIPVVLNSWVEMEHGLTVDPLRVRADVIARCAIPEQGYQRGEYAVGLVGGDSNMPLVPVVTADKVVHRINAALCAFHRTTGGRVALNKLNWALYLRIFY